MSKVIGNYRVLKMIAEGGFARIYQAEHQLLKVKACLKQCKILSPEFEKLLIREARLLWNLSDHHSIPHAKDYLVVKDGSGVLIMNYIDGKPLDYLISSSSKIQPEDACWITERLLECLYYCHYHGVIHGDIKPNNIMIETEKHDIKLIDFGLAVQMPRSGTRPIGFTDVYAAPEIREGKPPIPESDIYGAGMVLLCALGGDPIIKELPSDIPKSLQNYCYDLLQENPMMRLSWEKTDIIRMLANVRLQVFGRSHTNNTRR